LENDVKQTPVLSATGIYLMELAKVINTNRESLTTTTERQSDSGELIGAVRKRTSYKLERNRQIPSSKRRLWNVTFLDCLPSAFQSSYVPLHCDFSAVLPFSSYLMILYQG